MAVVSSPAFTLRFRHARTHEALRHTARELGLSMNELAERAIEHELAIAGVELEDRLRQAVELLRGYRRRGLDADIDAFALAEVTEDDPLRSRGARSFRDPLGVADVFADGSPEPTGAVLVDPVER